MREGSLGGMTVFSRTGKNSPGTRQETVHSDKGGCTHKGPRSTRCTQWNTQRGKVTGETELTGGGGRYWWDSQRSHEVSPEAPWKPLKVLNFRNDQLFRKIALAAM